MKKILVIEDEPEMRRNLTTILRLEQFHPLAAENGRVGFALAKQEKPDLILCDVMMPELDGFALLAELRHDSLTVAIPFIFLTAKAAIDDVRAGMSLGADDYLTKPFKQRSLTVSHGSLAILVTCTVTTDPWALRPRLSTGVPFSGGTKLSIQLSRYYHATSKQRQGFL
jgi:CheY-like chemotaxis protein